MDEYEHGAGSTNATDIAGTIEANNLKHTADTIQRELAAARNSASRANRRWIWELMQNAKDAPNRFGRVKIEIDLKDNALAFRHNGDPFEVRHLAALIQQVSSKPPDGDDPDMVGKFGTGFVATHLLAENVHLTGHINRPGGARRFRLILDRSAGSSAALQINIRDALAWLIRIDTNSEAAPDYEARRVEDDLDTEFLYHLATEENRDAARTGVEDLIHTLPATLVNIPTIAEVRIRSAGRSQGYRCESERLDDHVSRYTVVIEDSAATARAVQFLAFETAELRLLATVDGSEGRALVPPTDVQPRLHRGFPLIGSERFHFPFILAGHRFFPTDQRDGLLLNGATKDVARNHEILQAAVDAAIAFTDWLIAHGCTNLYVLADTRMPRVELEEPTINKIREHQYRWREALLDRPLVETDVGSVKLRDSRISRSHPGADTAANIELRRLVAALRGPSKVPQEALLTRWITAIGPDDEIKTWQESLFESSTDLVATVENARLHGAVIPADGSSGIVWLNRLYAFLATQKLANLCEEHAIVPNQHGAFRKLSSLYRERSNDRIPGPILDVLALLGPDWRADLLDREIELEIPASRERGLREASQELNQRLLPEPKDKAEYNRRLAACVAVLRLTTPNTREDSYRRRLLKFACRLSRLTAEHLEVESLENLQFSTATRLVTQYVSMMIASFKTISNLADRLHCPESEARAWLNDYLTLVDESEEHRAHVSTYAIVPNLNGNLCLAKDLQAFGTKEQRLDATLIDILGQLDPKHDLRPKLVADDFDLALPPYTFETLGSVLVRTIDALAGKEEQHRVPLLLLIEWCTTHPEQCDRYLKSFKETSKHIFFKLTLAGTNSGEQIMQIMRKPEVIPQLAELATMQTDELNAVMAHASQLRADNASFRFLQEIGSKMESLFKQTLVEEGIPANVKFRGIGAWDFEMTNITNQRQFFIELKSWKHAEHPQPIRLALSQAKQAGLGDKPYAICVVRRDGSTDDMTTDNIRENLRYLKDLPPHFAAIRDEIMYIERIQRSSGDIHLDIPGLNEAKVLLTHTFIEQHGRPYAELIADIRAALQ